MILGKLYFIYEKLIEIQSLYNIGLRGNDKDIYLKLDSISRYVNELDQNYCAKLDINKKFKSLLKFSDLQMEIIQLQYTIDYPDYDIIGIVAATRKRLEELFNSINEFLERELPIDIYSLNSLLNNHTFIDLNKFNIIIVEEDIEFIKDVIRSKLNNEYDSFSYKTLELYYYPPSELVNVSSHRLHWNLNFKSNLSDLKDAGKLNPYSEYLLKDLPINKLLEIASDFIIDINNLKISFKKDGDIRF